VCWTDEQDGGKYRLKKRNDVALFGYVVGPHSWKKFLFPPEQRIFRARKTTGGFEVVPENIAAPKLAFLGVRSCELHAMAIQDKVFLGGPFVDPAYQARRRNVFIIAVNCGQAGGTCFCVSMKTGPKAASGFDLALTEILDGQRHYFVVESGSEAGRQVLEELPHRPAEAAEIAAAAQATAGAASQMGRALDTTGIKELLYRNLEHPQWERVAGRCLSCANCTLACPTCFCTNVEDVSDLTGEHAERWRKWDSCFTIGFSYISGGAVRSSVKSRYRQWLTHKLATWMDQFGTSGCVGCGRCITWCPVAIDLTEEVRVIRQSERRVPPPKREIL
jgi:sulfhydrogenase subunit beta (sulfur reductase)